MGKTKPSIPKGTRDFGPSVVRKRQYIINIIKDVFEKFGFAPLETPTMENLSVLTGKYGDEGDQLLFKILNTKDFLKNANQEDFDKGYKGLLPKIAEKGLRYDLTVPFARYVAMNQSDIAFPFKRYQIQPVWRSDRPQRGRYREFYQCDADVVGTDSLLCESEVILMIDEVLTTLGISNFTIKLNNRKILEGICESAGVADQFTNVVVALDKLDKVGDEGVEKELLNRGISESQADLLLKLIKMNVTELKEQFSNSEIGLTGIDEVEEVFSYLPFSDSLSTNVELDISLARGLSYYTGCIFEVVVNNVSIGSISGGGRYDDLTSGFGLKDVSGVGFSFGLDRIYDVLESLELFPELGSSPTQVLIIAKDEVAFSYAIPVLKELRANNIKSELYPDIVKFGKSMSYADKKAVPYTIVIGDNEMESGLLGLKNMKDGNQSDLSVEEIIKTLVS